MSAKPYLFEEFLKILEGNNFKIGQEIERYVEANIPPLLTQKCLSLFIGVDHRLIHALQTKKSTNYRQFKLKQKNGKVRTISAPRTYLKVVQWWILKNVLEIYSCPSYVQGFKKGRSFYTNAVLHKGARHILNVDIKDFFPSINIDVCEDCFLEMGFQPFVAHQLAELCTFNGSLPQGAPTSPMLANIVCKTMDETLAGLALAHNYIFSRYADDISFSTKLDQKIPQEFLEAVREIIETYGFKLNDAKTKFMGQGARMEVTGLVVNKNVSLPRTWRKKIRAIYHQANSNPKKFKERIPEIRGYQGVLKVIDGTEGKLFLEGEGALKKIENARNPYGFLRLSVIKKIFRKNWRV